MIFFSQSTLTTKFVQHPPGVHNLTANILIERHHLTFLSLGFIFLFKFTTAPGFTYFSTSDSEKLPDPTLHQQSCCLTTSAPSFEHST